MKTHLYLSCLFLLLSTAIFSQNRLSIYYPLWWNEYMGEGTIDEAVFTLRPQGLFVEVGMDFTFSFPENYLSIEDSLEIVFDFHLPKEAIVNDSWLWVGDQVVRADIAEIWTAIQTYEEIVDRQQDPSVLFERPDGGHQLRIFPLVTQESRRVKINYLLPARWTQEELAVMLPTDLISVSNSLVQDFRLLVFPDPAWENYRIREFSNWEFQPVTDPDYGPCLEMQVPIGNAAQPLHFVMDTPLTPDGLFVGRYTGGQENYYHLAYFPDNDDMITEKPSRVMAVVHYEDDLSSFSRLEIMDILRNSLKERLDEQDFFNLTVCIGSYILTASPSGWLPADDATIDLAFDNVPASAGGAYKPLIELLLTAGDIMTEAAQGGEMLLLANTDEYGGNWLQPANDALAAFEDHFNGDFPVHICDFQTVYYPTWWNDCDNWEPGSICYKGNEFFNYQLAALTGGSFFDLMGNGADLITNLTTQLNAIDGLQVIYELHTDMTNGLCYNRYPVTYLGQSRYMHLPVLQVGKYAGEFPMTVEFSAFHNGQLFNESFIVEEDQVVELDTLAEESWVGNHLDMLEANNNSVFEAIDLSLQHRVLSKYTAFIALDPALGGVPCFDCLFDGEILIETTEQLPPLQKKLSAFPNPFSEGIALQLNGIEAADVRIYDQLGRLLRVFEPSASIWWDGRNAEGQLLPAGVYFVIATCEDGLVYSLKINKL